MTPESLKEGEVFLIDKPLEWTSFDVVKKMRNLIKRNYGIKKIKIGHAGTLDPLATGLMILCCGKKTKEISKFQDLPKTYTGSFMLGATRPSFDKETAIDNTYSTKNITVEQIHTLAKDMRGEQLQTPPLFSAKKINGERAYKLARKGIEKKLAPVSISVYSFEITGIEMPEVFFKIECSKGTYIRSIANDFGEKLKCGAYLSSLRRTSIGKYNIEHAQSIENFENQLKLASAEN